jgi:hypothetical protein
MTRFYILIEECESDLDADRPWRYYGLAS